MYLTKLFPKTPGVYIITNKINFKFYIGSIVNLLRRWYDHRTALKSNKHYNGHLQNSFNKYGMNNFEFIVIEQFKFDQITDMLKLEEKLINKHYGHGYCFNEKLAVLNLNGKRNPFYGKKHSDESRKKISLATSIRLKNFNPNKGLKRTLETKQKISKSKTGKIFREKHPDFDHNIYIFENKNIQEIFNGYRYDFIKKYNLNPGNIAWLIKGRSKSVKGWRLSKIPILKTSSELSETNAQTDAITQ